MRIYIASHKHMELPTNFPYKPLFVGAYRIPQSERLRQWDYDDSKLDNISYDNSFFCELTGQYWIWRHSDEDIKGLVHYRRYLGSQPTGTPQDKPLTETEIRDLLTSHDCLIARREELIVNDQPASIAHHYRHLHSSNDLQLARMSIKKLSPDYLLDFDSTMLDCSLSPCNILIAPKELFDGYSRWLFTIMDDLSKRIDPVNYRDTYQQRVFGFLAERLLNVYIRHNKLNAKECNLIDDRGSCIAPCRWQRHGHSNLPPIQRFKPISDGTDYSKVFDINFYLKHYPDIADCYSDNPKESLQHFIHLGINEGRTAHPSFSIKSYINGNPQLYNELGNKPVSMVQFYIKHPHRMPHKLGFENMKCTPGESLMDKKGQSLKLSTKMAYNLNCFLAENRPLID